MTAFCLSLGPITAIQSMFEVQLKAMHPHELNITYTMDDILSYIDKMCDMGLLV